MRLSQSRRTVARRARPAAFAWVLAAVMAVAWLALWLWGASPYAHYLGHDDRSGDAGGWPVLPLFLTGWALMIAAMMLPTATGLLRTFAVVVRTRRERGLLQALVVVGFVTTWVGVGWVVRAVDVAVHDVVAAVGWLQARPRLLGAGALVLAGLYQFTPLKHRCLTACRTPRSFIYRYWGGGRPAGDALRIGLAYGRSCVGCCWALMLVMFALGTASLAWMLGLGALMAVEKTTAVGPRLVLSIGLSLIGLGLATAFAGWPT
jgi:predicted metal-binding membrane protein